jgi:hypothetical protein|tara:strand:- start:628 stop:915 length:288 start_codon:yes stop_codon:yes gene_type:complete
MTIQEIMERSGLDKETLAIAYIKDALHLVNSSYDEDIATWKTTITKASSSVNNIYPFPANMIKLKGISIKDTNDDKYKRIRRLVEDPVVIEDVSP